MVGRYQIDSTNKTRYPGCPTYVPLVRELLPAAGIPRDEMSPRSTSDAPNEAAALTAAPGG
jgi:hypothetical protein